MTTMGWILDSSKSGGVVVGEVGNLSEDVCCRGLLNCRPPNDDHNDDNVNDDSDDNDDTNRHHYFHCLIQIPHQIPRPNTIEMNKQLTRNRKCLLILLH